MVQMAWVSTAVGPLDLWLNHWIIGLGGWLAAR